MLVQMRLSLWFLCQDFGSFSWSSWNRASFEDGHVCTRRTRNRLYINISDRRPEPGHTLRQLPAHEVSCFPTNHLARESMPNSSDATIRRTPQWCPLQIRTNPDVIRQINPRVSSNCMLQTPDSVGRDNNQQSGALNDIIITTDSDLWYRSILEKGATRKSWTHLYRTRYLRQGLW